MSTNRRQFLSFVGSGALAAITGRASAAPPVFPLPRSKPAGPASFKAIDPSRADELLLPAGVKYDTVIRWGDPLGTTAPDGSGEHFGFNNDFNCFFPIDALTGGQNADEGLLWTNHEYPAPLFLHGYTTVDEKAKKIKTADQIRTERASVGGSVVRISRKSGAWAYVPGDKHNRRFTADYPIIPTTGPASTIVPFGTGTLANCSGGQTPWNTLLSCEENYPDFNDDKLYNYRWKDVPALAIDERQYGWVVEVDPFGVLPPRKHTALGRFKHENAAVRTGPAGKLVVYMGDDEVDQHLYKYVSDDPVSDLSRADSRLSLEHGTLYAADFAKGEWIPLVFNTHNKVKIEKSEAFAAGKKADPALQITSQAELLLNTRVAARGLGATPLDRCEDCEIHPLDGSLYVALTNNSKHGNLYGHIVRLVEDNPEGTKFQYEVFLAGGPQTGVCSPDNLAFDRDGNLWVVCDMSSDKMGRGAYKPFGNNGMFVVPTTGPAAGYAYQFASGPIDAELTGPWFTPNQDTLFLSVQHPGEESESLDKLTSHWPAGGESLPRPAVVAVRLK
jgi:uncharacterized protein